MEKQGKLCRLCLKDCGNDFMAIEKNVTEILVFLLKINLFINEEAVMCANCAENIKDCSDFKRICLDVKDSVVEPINEDDHMCRLCMGSLNICSFTSLYSRFEDVTLDQIMLNKYLPELDIHVAEKPGICVSCRVSLQRYFGWITNFSIVEERIKKYCDAACIDATGPITLKKVLEFTTKNTLDNVDTIKTEDKFCGDAHLNGLKCSNDLYAANSHIEEVIRIKIGETFFEELDCKIELKPEDLMEMEDRDSNNIPEFVIKCEADNPHQTDAIEMKQSCCQEDVNELEIKQENSNSLQDGDISPHMDTYFNLPVMQECSSTQPAHRTLPQVLFDESDIKVKRHQRESCSFKSKHNLKNHLSSYKNSSEVTMYKCEHCSFETKRKWCLKTHLLCHKDLLEVTTYRCEHCSYQTKYKYHLKSHFLHRHNPSKVTTYKCEYCSFHTKYKMNLENHLPRHKDLGSNYLSI